jgi:hypothetical protein
VEPYAADVKSKVYEAFIHMEAAADADGALPRTTRARIAIGISADIPALKKLAAIKLAN